VSKCERVVGCCEHMVASGLLLSAGGDGWSAVVSRWGRVFGCCEQVEMSGRLF
jgi:hypothetical protein